MDKTQLIERVSQVILACRNAGEDETVVSVLAQLALDKNDTTLGQAIGYAHLACVCADGRHLPLALENLQRASASPEIASVIEMARAWQNIRALASVRSLVPGFAVWFRQAVLWFDYYSKDETSFILPEDTTLIYSLVAEDPEPASFWNVALATADATPAYPSQRRALLTKLATGEKPEVTVATSRPDATVLFQTYAAETGIQILAQLQTGENGSSSVFMAIDTDGLVKIFKEVSPPDSSFARLGIKYQSEKEIYDRVGKQPFLPICYGTVDIGDTQFLRQSMVYGQSLADYTRTDNRLSAEEAEYVVGKIADHLSALHVRGVSYLDVRPQNFKIDGKEVYLLDLGDCREISNTEQIDTFVHDPRYTAPETALRLKASVASDVFQLGVLYYELLTGEHPFAGTTVDTGDREIALVTFALANATMPYSPPSDDRFQLIARMLEKDPALRPTMREVSEALRQPARAIRQRGRSSASSLGTVLMPARMGIPHRGHIDFMARILEAGFDLIVSLQEAYTLTQSDPLPKWVTLKMVATALKHKGFSLDRVRFLLTPFFRTGEEHRLHFLMMPGFEKVVAVASGNLLVHDMFAGVRPVLDQCMLFAVEGEDYETRSWGEHLRSAVRSGDYEAFQHYIADGAEEIMTFTDMRLNYCPTTVEFVCGHVYVMIKNQGGEVMGRRRVRTYSTPEGAVVELLRAKGRRVEILDPYVRDTQLVIDGVVMKLQYVQFTIDEQGNEIISYVLSS